MECKNCKEECIGKTPCTDCRKIDGKCLLLIPIAAFVICYFIGVTI